MPLTRRSLLYRAAAVSGAGLLPRRLHRLRRQQPGQDPPPQSGMITGEPKPLPYESLEGFLGSEQLRWHHESHYGGALRGFSELDQDPTGSHGPRVAKANSVVLHELYFDNMAAAGGDPGEATAAALAQRFGSVER